MGEDINEYKKEEQPRGGSLSFPLLCGERTLKGYGMGVVMIIFSSVQMLG